MNTIGNAVTVLQQGSATRTYVDQTFTTLTQHNAFVTRLTAVEGWSLTLAQMSQQIASFPASITNVQTQLTQLQTWATSTTLSMTSVNSSLDGPSSDTNL